MFQLEVCVDSIESSLNAVEAGASRLELCSALSEGGLTPTLGLFKTIKKAINSKVPIYVMIRCRRGNDFNYSELEMDAMLEDVESLNEADGFVFGALTDNFEIDVEKCRRFVEKCGKKSKTFHRAFDLTNKKNIEDNLKLVSDLGFSRLLSSGLESTAALGLSNLKLMMNVKDLPIIIMPGAGISPKNLEQILRKSGAKEFHASCRSKKVIINDGKIISMGGAEDLEPLMICDPHIVKNLLAIAQSENLYKNARSHVTSP